MKKNILDLKCGGEMYVILVYDISNEQRGSRRWRKVFSICKRYLINVQKSVFEGELTSAQVKQLEYEIKNEIDNEIDSVLIFKSRNERWLDKEIWGLDDNATSQFL